MLNQRLDEWRAQHDAEPPPLPETTSDGPIEKLGTGVRRQMLATLGSIVASGLFTIFVALKG